MMWTVISNLRDISATKVQMMKGQLATQGETSSRRFPRDTLACRPRQWLESCGFGVEQEVQSTSGVKSALFYQAHRERYLLKIVDDTYAERAKEIVGERLPSGR